MAPITTEVGVIGAGYAGLAAAVALADQGISVCVYEAAQHLGGRARAVERRELTLDNGQHILIGAYRETLALIERVSRGSQCVLRRPLTWHVHPHFELRAADLPAPWHLGLGLLRARGLTLAERIACARLLAWGKRTAFRLARDITVSELLRLKRQPDNVVRYVWHPLCIAALNTPPDDASAQVFLNVVRDGLAARRESSDLVFPRVDLTSLFPAPAADFIRARGGVVQLGEAALRIDTQGPRFELTTTRGRHAHRAIVVATQPDRVRAIAGHIEQLAAPLATIGKLAYQPIVTIYLSYARKPDLPFPLLGMHGGYAQWLFDREQITGQRGLIAAVISAKGRAQALPHTTLVKRVHAEIAVLFPQIDAPLWAQVIEEKRATFACVAGIERPDQRTALAGLCLAGDYTASDYPATIESAVRSGLRAAALLSDHLAATAAK